MQPKLAVIALAALVLSVGGANAQHRTSTPVRHGSHIFERTYGYASREPSQAHSLRDVYESTSQGHQSFPNPDRDYYGPNVNCCWE